MASIIDQFVAATKRADQAGFDWLELQAGHGYLLSSFISPLTNQRTDTFGGSLENRLRFPLAVVSAVRKVYWKTNRSRCEYLRQIGWKAERQLMKQC